MTMRKSFEYSFSREIYFLFFFLFFSFLFFLSFLSFSLSLFFFFPLHPGLFRLVRVQYMHRKNNKSKQAHTQRIEVPSQPNPTHQTSPCPPTSVARPCARHAWPPTHILGRNGWRNWLDRNKLGWVGPRSAPPRSADYPAAIQRRTWWWWWWWCMLGRRRRRCWRTTTTTTTTRRRRKRRKKRRKRRKRRARRNIRTSSYLTSRSSARR
ncbi:hypothetical protein IWX49DRAFT_81165 [Phyllosticta citricarpa]